MRLATVVVTAVLGVCLTAPARADVADHVSRRIAAVTLSINGHAVVDERLLDLVETHVGQPLAMKDVRESIVHLFSLARFEDVRAEAEASGDGVALTYVLVPFGRVSGIDLITHGAPGIDAGLLRQLLAARFGVVPNPARMNEMARAIEQSVKSRGYLRASVTPRATPQAGEAIRLDFDISAGPRAVIDDIKVQGEAGVPDLAKALEVGLREPYERDRLDASIERFIESRRRQGYYDVSLAVAATESAGGETVALLFTVNRGPLTRLVFAGDALPANRRNDLVQIAAEGSTAEDVLEDATNRIEGYLRTQGYRDALAPHAKEDAGDERLLTFTITKGPVYRVARIEITGNSSVPLATLQSRLRIRAGQPFSEEVLEADVAQVEDLYRRDGFAAVAVSATPVMPAASGGEVPVTIGIDVREGVRTLVNSVEFSGAQENDATALRSVLGLQPGQPYFSSQLAIDRDTIQLHYANLGYPSAVVASAPGLSQDGTRADIVFTIRPGAQVFVEHVLIVGNERTSTATIERELRVKAGDPLGLEALNESQRRLASLGLFRRARIAELGHGDETRRDVLVTVEEAPVTTIGYGGGLEIGQRTRRADDGVGSAIEELDFAPRAFFEVGRRNLFGKNRSINLFTRVSLRRSDNLATPIVPIVPGVVVVPEDNTRGFSEYRIIGTYREPRLLNTTADAFLTGTLEQQARSSFNFSRRAFSAEVGRRVTPTVSISGSYQIQRTELFDEQIDPGDQLLIDRAFPQVRLSSFALSIVRSTRDDQADPTRGRFLSTNSQIAGRRIGSEVGFVREYLTAQTFHPLPGALHAVFAGSARLGMATGFTQLVPSYGPDGTPILDENGDPVTVVSHALPASERFFAGGDTTVRGFALDQLGTPETIDKNGFPIGGNGLVVLNAELRVPVRGGFGVVGFVDAGNVFAAASDISLNELRGTVGFGIRYKSPIGPIRVDLGFKTDRRYKSAGNRESLTALHISLGQAF